MGFLSYLLYPWGFLLQGLAIVHFIRRRPDNYWIFVILFLGPLGAIIYLLVEALPDIGLVGQSFKVFPRRKRIGELEAAIRDNPSAGNYEELGGLYMDDGNLQRRERRSTKPSPRGRTRSTLFTAAAFAPSCWVTRPPHCPTLSAWSAKRPTTISSAPRDYSPTPTRRPDKRKKPRRSSRR